MIHTVYPEPHLHFLLQHAHVSTNFAPYQSPLFVTFSGHVEIDADGSIHSLFQEVDERKRVRMGQFEPAPRGYLWIENGMASFFEASRGVIPALAPKTGLEYDATFVEKVKDIRTRCKARKAEETLWTRKQMIERDCGDRQLNRCGLLAKHLITFEEFRGINKGGQHFMENQAASEKNRDALPFFSPTGYKAIASASLSPEHQTLMRALHKYTDEHVGEFYPEDKFLALTPGPITCYETDQWQYVPKDKSVEQRVVDACREAMVEWLSIPAEQLLQSYPIVYPRTYKRGAILESHIDRKDSHVLGCIFSIRQRDMNRPWKLRVSRDDAINERFPTAPVDVVTNEGDLLLYESATTWHGRPEPLDGEEVTNMFVHFKPINWDPHALKKREYLFLRTNKQEQAVHQDVVVEKEKKRRWTV